MQFVFETTGVVIDMSPPLFVFDNIKQSLAFGVPVIVPNSNLSPKMLSDLEEFCDKSSMGCIIAPDLHIGTALFKQYVGNIAYYYKVWLFICKILLRFPVLNPLR